MSSFTKKLVVSPLENGRKWTLTESFDYYQDVNPNSVISVPENFETDFASIPRFLWIFLPPYQRIYGKPSIIHDYLCVMNELTKRKCKDFTNQDSIDGVKLPNDKIYTVWGKNEHGHIIINRKVTDKIFLEAMLVLCKNKKDRFLAYLVYYFVRLYAKVKRIK